MWWNGVTFIWKIRAVKRQIFEMMQAELHGCRVQLSTQG